MPEITGDLKTLMVTIYCGLAVAFILLRIAIGVLLKEPDNWWQVRVCTIEQQEREPKPDPGEGL